MPVIYPLDGNSIKETQEYREKTTRPLPDSGVRLFGRMMISESWDDILEDDTSSQQDDVLQIILTKMLDETCPTKTVRLGITDKPFVTKELKILDRQRRREYRRH